MKKIFKIFAIVLSIFIFNKNVFAEEYAQFARSWIESESSIYQELLSKYTSTTYNKYSVGTEGTKVFLYGKTDCDFSASNCNYQYQGGKNFEDIIKENVTCINNEKYVFYQFQGNVAEDYKTFNDSLAVPTDTTSGTVLWSEQYIVTCQNEVSGENTYVELGNNYTSSTTETSPQTGVETYYIILGLIALLSYIVMTYVKKHNLFKNI